MRSSSSQRHFPYRHPTFGRKARPLSPIAWEGSVYFLWWQYLRRSEKYRLTCEQGGEGDLRELYAHFGDVRTDDFKAWWSEGSRGFRLFAEPKATDGFRVITQSSEVVIDQSTLILSMPLALPKRFLLKKTREILSKVHSGRRGVQAAKASRAQFQISGQPNVPALTIALRVFDHWKANPQMPLWQIGNSLPKFQMEHRIRSDDSAGDRTNKKNVLAATVSRYLRRAKRTIAATEFGRFPRLKVGAD